MNTTARILSFYCSKAFLTSRSMLHTLFWINFLGTIYGYYWYWDQIQDTLAEKPAWMVILVPDSPTGSLFFTLSLLYLIVDSYSGKARAKDGQLRRIIEGLAVFSSFKYGIWAVSIILAANAMGVPSSWQDWLLAFSHLGMALEALLFSRFFKLDALAIGIGAAWLFASDIVDYGYRVFPYMQQVLIDHIEVIRNYTVMLSTATTAIFVTISRRMAPTQKR
ncbi:DUF1405 domain-containing protein [Gorillibacterium massiliense]|uniref:DUF1405 domain-containing protein n=1 Tax=Gorillibacterium massiliense TaxID=1280390 RepID=UPI0004AD9B6C|nr:DUF1405 domain-containing protein [Gorillibacterium massiliense]